MTNESNVQVWRDELDGAAASSKGSLRETCAVYLATWLMEPYVESDQLAMVAGLWALFDT
jgi:hypothetical protein